MLVFIPAAQHPLDDSSAHILRGPRKYPLGIGYHLRRKSLSLIRQLPHRTDTDGFRNLSRNGLIVCYRRTFVNPKSHSTMGRIALSPRDRA